MTAFLLLSIIGKALEIRKFMAMNDLPEQSYKEHWISKRGAEGTAHSPCLSSVISTSQGPLQARHHGGHWKLDGAHVRLVKSLLLDTGVQERFSFL